jgi:hypothetical protein
VYSTLHGPKTEPLPRGSILFIEIISGILLEWKGVCWGWKGYSFWRFVQRPVCRVLILVSPRYIPQYLFEFVARKSTQTAMMKRAMIDKTYCTHRQRLIYKFPLGPSYFPHPAIYPSPLKYKTRKAYRLRLPASLHNSGPPAILINGLNIIPKSQRETSKA